MSLRTQLELILKGGRVQRFHARPSLMAENVAEHSFLVAWVCYLVYDEAPPSGFLLLAALSHDLPEHMLGDMPSPAKKRLGMQDAFKREESNIFAAAGMRDFEASLTPLETEILKFADNFAGYLKCVYESQMGNKLLDNTRGRYRDYLVDCIRDATYMNQATCTQLMAIVEGE